MVPAAMNPLLVVGQMPIQGPASDIKLPTPLSGQQPGSSLLQLYEAHRPFFGSAPVGGLDIVTSKRKSKGHIH